ncbi:peptidylprolyl isomerase [Pararhodobacter zhoushanensis]|uniref:SurA N-terminal domain-containing protein n=1 Tax=Pararhodobacter zhoushanensis TaxID=2479545 RepID=A0ABT3GZ40_9RHOB|nr:peptidylprolyl isomerase [Pararhodobacter zhoushanensis]MCW1932831.1 SurA N-terminal domain-containing protein [Pararhodobacter zhoushanensis]
MAKKNSAQSILAWGMMILLIAGLGGFGIDSFLGSRVTSIGSVGDRQISTQSYARALQSEMRAVEQQIGQPVTIAFAQQVGIDQQVRAQLITQAALENEAGRIGISVGDENVQRTVVGIRAFQGPTGNFDMDAYRFALQNVGQSPAEFEEEVRRDAARGILQAATAAGVETPDNLRSALLGFYAMRHNFTLFTLTEANLPAPVADPEEPAIIAYYAANIADFTAPETRSITYAWLTPEMVLDTVEVDEESIRALYEQRIDDFVQPERRLVERLVFGSDDEAQAAKARLDAGEITFDALVEERGLSLEDADMGDVSEAQLGAAGAAVFGLDNAGTVVGPLPSNLGPALFRMNAILNAQETPFEDARDELRAELAGDGARRAIQDQQEGFDDLLAGGATLEQLAEETPMQLGTIEWTRDTNEGIAAYSEFGTAAAAVSADDFPELAGLSDGGLFAIRLDSVTPPTPRPIEDVREAVVAGARVAAVDAALQSMGQTLSADLVAEGPETFGETRDLSPEVFENITRLDRLTQVPATMLETIMASDVNTPVMSVAEGRLLLVYVGETEAPDSADEQTEQLTGAINEQIGQALAQDVFFYFASALQAEAGITLNQPAIDAVHATFP